MSADDARGGAAVCICGHFERDHEDETAGGCYGYVDCWCREFVLAGEQLPLPAARAASDAGR